MLSLPTIQPPLPHTLPFTHNLSQTSHYHTPAFTTHSAQHQHLHPQNGPHHHHQPHQNQPHAHHSQQQQHPAPRPRPTALTHLLHDERLLALRKQNIRRFGAGWLRPPGVQKTLQGFEDERLEREEAEQLRQREEARLAMEEEGMMEGMEVVDTEGVEEGEERDLDDEIPEGGGGGLGMGVDLSEEEEEEAQASEEEGPLWTDSDEDAEEEDGMLFGEQGFGGDEGEGDYAEVPGEIPGMRELNAVIERHAQQNRVAMGHPRFPADRVYGFGGYNMDDEVPEADSGSYEHTDTELEDESEDEAPNWLMQGGNAQRAQAPVRASQQFRTPGGQGAGTHDALQGRSSLSASFTGGGSFLGGSVFGGSPLGDSSGGRVMSGGSRSSGGRRVSGRRGQGREN